MLKTTEKIFQIFYKIIRWHSEPQIIYDLHNRHFQLCLKHLIEIKIKLSMLFQPKLKI